MAATDRPDAYEKLALLQILTHSHGQADAYFDTIGDAAALAANQVQDVRLEYLEKGPTVTAADVVLELLLAMAVQHVGGAAVAAITRTVVSRVLASRRALLAVSSRTELGDEVAATYRAAKLKFIEAGPDPAFKRLLPPDDAVVKTLLRQGDAQAVYTETPFDVADLATKVVFHAGRQVPQKPTRHTRLTPHDSPGVAILDNASLFVVRQKTFNKILFDDMKHIVLLDLLSRADVLMLIDQLRVYTSSLYRSQSLPEVKEQYKLYFEACIWSRVLYPPPSLKGVPPVFDLPKGGREFTEYLLARLVNPEAGVRFQELIRAQPSYARRRQDEPNNQYFVLQSLLTYLRTLRDTADQLENRLPAEAQTQWSYPR